MMAVRITRQQRLERRIAPQPRRRRRLVIGILLVPVLAALCMCAYVAAGVAYFAAGYLYLSEAAPGGAFAAVKEGSPAPDFRLPTIDGRSVALSDFRGGPVMVTVWASWCAPCMMELSEIGRMVEDWGDEAPVVLAINMGEQRGRVQAAMARVDADVIYLLDTDQRVARSYGAWSLPTTVMADAEGIVRSARTGAMGPEDLDAFVRSAWPPDWTGGPTPRPRPPAGPQDRAYPAACAPATGARATGEWYVPAPESSLAGGESRTAAGRRASSLAGPAPGAHDCPATGT